MGLSSSLNIHPSLTFPCADCNGVTEVMGSRFVFPTLLEYLPWWVWSFYLGLRILFLWRVRSLYLCFGLPRLFPLGLPRLFPLLVFSKVRNCVFRTFSILLFHLGNTRASQHSGEIASSMFLESQYRGCVFRC
jgi:hypothetical protein